ncbi:MAG: methionyl-tRNA formyltransferase [Burkholderiaceae bacterium]
MRLIFAGTPAFAEVALRALIAAGHQIELVLTQPDRPAGRGKRLAQSAVKQTALAHGLAVFQPVSLRRDEVLEPLRDCVADAMIVAAYGLILPRSVLAIPRLGCLNIHASLLPRWRGAAPIQRAIQAGDRRSGITIMQMDAGLDTGPMLLAEAIDIGADETGGQLHDRLAELGGYAIVKALDLLASGQAVPMAQPEQGVTYAHKLERADGELDWTQPATVLHDQIRAFDPVPGCTTTVGGERLKVWRARPAGQEVDTGVEARRAAPGQVLQADRGGVFVQTGRGVLELLEWQRPGGRRLAALDALAGHPIPAGSVFI